MISRILRVSDRNAIIFGYDGVRLIAYGRESNRPFCHSHFIGLGCRWLGFYVPSNGEVLVKTSRIDDSPCIPLHLLELISRHFDCSTVTKFYGPGLQQSCTYEDFHLSDAT